MKKLIEGSVKVALPAMILLLFWVNSYAQFAGGRGTRLDPWLVSTPEHLSNVRNYLGAANNDKYFLQINDIDLDVPPWNSNQGWSPIGSNNILSFRGVYDGDYHRISGLTINYPNVNNIGLFGFTNDAVIENIIFENASIIGLNGVGIVVGYKIGGTVRNCSTTGSVTGRDNVGGITGIVTTNGHINACFSRANINARLRVGGITGSNFAGSVVRNSFATGNISGESGSIGGLIGRVQASLTVSCYSTGRVTTPSPYYGGLIGSENNSTTTDSYWNVETSEVNLSSGGEGRNTNQMTYPYADNTYRNWDFNTVWRADPQYLNNNGYPHQFWTMPDVPSFLSAEAYDAEVRLNWRGPLISEPDAYNIYRDGQLIDNTAATSYNDLQVINFYRHTYYVTAVYGEEESAPSNIVQATPHPSPPYLGFGTEEEPYRIESAGQLSFMRNYLRSHFIQTVDIDLGTPPWNSREGWQPIGSFVDHDSPDNAVFSGSFNGNGHKIANLTINNRDSDYQGLFGYIQEATLSDIHLRNAKILGNKYVGGIAGYARDTKIDKSCVQGHIQSVSDYAGGLVGFSIGIGNYITNSYTNTNVYGSSYVGGLVGYSTTTTYSIFNCYATGSVKGTSNCVGGLVGYSWGDIRNSFSTSFVATTDTVHIGGLVGRSDFGQALFSYWDTDTSDQPVSAGGSPLSTTGMIRRESYQNWDFADVWTIRDNETYPWFQWQDICEAHNIPGPYRLRANPGSAIVRLNWQPPAVGNVIRYNVFRNNEFLSSVDAPDVNYMDTTVSNYYEYSYYVVAVLSDERNSSPSNPVVTIPFTFADGTGTLNDPYLVDSAHQLHAVKSQLDKHFRQIADIDLSSPEWSSGTGWHPIGTTAINSFTGSYNGGGHSIYNLTINNPVTDYQGLFGYIRGGTVQNIGIINGNITGRDNVGGLAGRISDGSLIENSFYYGYITGTGVDIGGLVGTNLHSRITNCYTYGSVNANSHNVGGLVGWNEHSVIENSFSMADVEVIPLTDFLSYDIGGLVGFNINDSHIRNSRAGGNVTATLARRVGGLVGDNSLTEGELGSTITNSYATGAVVADSWVGGLVGRNYSTPAATRLSEISESYSTGSVFSFVHNTGGLVGRNDNAVISRSFSRSPLSVQGSNGPYNQGGLVGRNTIGGIITDCYAIGEVNGHARVGGLIGDNFRDAGDTVYVANSFAAGRVTRAGQLPAGGLIARNEGGVVTNSYWDRDSTERWDSAAGIARNTTQMTYPYDGQTYQGWDFERVWQEDRFNNRNSGYPYFRWQKFVTEISIRGSREVFIPFAGINRYSYEVRIYDQNDSSMNGATVIWHLEDTDGYENVANGFITIDLLGTLTVQPQASEGAFYLEAISDADHNITARLHITISPSEQSPNPSPAANPTPQHRAEAVEHPLTELSWSYQEDPAYTNPVGFRVYINDSENFDDQYEWIDYIDGKEDYEANITIRLGSLTTYYWKVIPTTDYPDGNNRNTSYSPERRRLRYEARENSIKRGDAEDCPLWNFTTAYGSNTEAEEIPLITSLHKNYPNPFNPETTIRFSLAEPAQVSIEVFNSRGQRVITLLEEYSDAGHHHIVWKGKDSQDRQVASGIYFYRMKSNDFTGHNKMLLIK